MKYLGPKAKKPVAYGVASVSGSVLAVCSCTVLPLFAGIYRMGAGLGPATAFLYAGPAINILAIILTAKVLGWKIGLARAIGAIVFSVIIGLIMHFLFRKEEEERVSALQIQEDTEAERSLSQYIMFFFSLVGILVFANWGGDPGSAGGLWASIYSMKWIITSIFSIMLAVILVLWFSVRVMYIGAIAGMVAGAALAFPSSPVIPFAVGIVTLSIALILSKGEGGEWFSSSWDFAKQILPLLFYGVLIAGALLGRPGNEGLIPSEWVSGAVGGNSLFANFFASIAGAFMYFATLTEIPILEGLLGNGMGNGPALALLLAGPALSLPNMLVIRGVLGTKKTIAYVTLVVIMATASGLLYGFIV
jgi:hypothetical protein